MINFSDSKIIKWTGFRYQLSKAIRQVMEACDFSNLSYGDVHILF